MSSRPTLPFGLKAIALLALLAFAAGCPGSTSSGSDPGPTLHDVEPDVGEEDAGADPDVGELSDADDPDVLPDGGDPDVPPDAGEPDVPADAGEPSDVSGDSGPVAPQPWSWCPEASAFVGGDGWTQAFPVTEGATYCAMFEEGRTLEEEVDYKGQLSFPPAEYWLPAGTPPPGTTAAIELPACGWFPARGLELRSQGEGEVKALANEAYGFLIDTWELDLPLVDQDDNPWQLRLRWWWEHEDGVSEPSLDGNHYSAWGEPAVNLWLCQGDCQVGSLEFFDSCHFDGVADKTAQVTFSGGYVDIVRRIGDSMAGTEPGLLVRVSGELDGVSFDQQDYWKLFYNPEHHHFDYHLIALFDEPIGAACGLKAEWIPAWPPSYMTPRIALVDCELAELEERAIDEITVE